MRKVVVVVVMVGETFTTFFAPEVATEGGEELLDAALPILAPQVGEPGAEGSGHGGTDGGLGAREDEAERDGMGVVGEEKTTPTESVEQGAGQSRPRTGHG